MAIVQVYRKRKNQIVEVLVDEEDLPEISRLSLYIVPGSASLYAYVQPKGERKGIALSRVLLKVGPSRSIEVDHINRNTLDNRRENLRVTRHARNSHNRIIRKQKRFIYPGVSQDSEGLFNVSLIVDGVVVYRKKFKKEEDAVEARKAAEKKHGIVWSVVKNRISHMEKLPR
jgi:hypothetical protein